MGKQKNTADHAGDKLSRTMPANAPTNGSILIYLNSVAIALNNKITAVELTGDGAEARDVVGILGDTLCAVTGDVSENVSEVAQPSQKRALGFI